MATGSGKTRTAIGCMRAMLAMEKIDRIIITVPNSLLKQWKGELREHIPRQDLKALFEYSSKEGTSRFQACEEWVFLIVTHSMLPRLLGSATWNTNSSIEHCLS